MFIVVRLLVQRKLLLGDSLVDRLRDNRVVITVITGISCAFAGFGKDWKVLERLRCGNRDCNVTGASVS